jgi:hypothetical protein
MTLLSLAGFVWVIVSEPGQVASSRGIWVIIVISTTLVALSSLESRMRRKSLFATRSPMTPEQVFSMHFRSAGLDPEVVVRLWREVARRLDVPADKLRPTDRFRVELDASGMFDVFDGKKDELARFAASYARTHGVVLDLTKVETVGELIEQMAAPAMARMARGNADG